MADIFINIPDSGSPTWKAPVPTPADLPPSGNVPGDARITLNNDDIYVWTGSTWVPVASPGAVGGITALIGDVTANGPGSAPATVQFVGGLSAANVASGAAAANAATSSNTPNTIVKRDGSGNFSAGTISASLSGNVTGNVTGNLTGNVTGNVSGSSSTFTGALSGDVTGTQSATAISNTTVTGKILTGFIAGPNSPVLASDSILIGLEKLQAQTSASTGSAITALTGDATATGPGSVPITLATVNGNVGTFGNSTNVGNFTVNAKGLITSAGNVPINFPVTSVTGSGNIASSGGSTPNITFTGILPSTSGGTGVNNSFNLTINGTSSINGNFTGTSSGTNTGDQTITLNGDVSGSGTGTFTTTLATVNGNVGSFGSSTAIPNFTVNAKGLITAAGSSVVIAPAGTLTGTTLAANVVNSSLTSVGTLTSLTVSGTISASNFSGSSSGSNTGDVTLAAVGSSPNANAASLSGQVLNLQPASASFPGVITTGTQTIAGAKTFSSDLAISSTSTTALTVNSTSLVVDATNNAIGIGTAPSTTTVLDIVNNSGSTKAIQVTGYGSNVGFRGRRANGTLSSPTQTLSGDTLTFFSGRGYGASQFAAASTGVVNIIATENFTNTSNATAVAFSSTPTGSVTSTERMRINSTGNVLIGTTTDNGNNQLQVTGSFLAGSSALVDAANIATNASLANRFTVTLAGNRNLSAPTNPTDGQKVIWIFTQDATGGRTLTFDTVFDFGNMPSLILSSGASKRDYMGAIYNSANTKWDVVAYSSTF